MRKLLASFLGALSLLGSAQSIDVTWDPVPAPFPVGYKVYYYLTPDSSTLKILDAQSATTVSITNVLAGRTYSLYVSSYWVTNSIESLPSQVITYLTPEIQVPVPIVLPAATNLALATLTYAPPSAYSARFVFNAAASTNVSGYLGYVWTSGWTSMIPSTIKSITFPKLTNDTIYQIAIASVGSTGTPGVSIPITFSHSLSTNWAGIGNFKAKASTSVVIGP